MPASNSGLVSLTQASIGDARTHTLFASFVDVPLDSALRGELPGCELLAEGNFCRVLECGPTSLGGPSAGTIHVRVDGAELLTAEPAESGAYGAWGSGDAFAPGDSVTISATGDEVGAFEATISAPNAPDVTLPTAIDRAAPLSLQWSASIADEVSLMLAPPTGGTMLTCRVPASEGGVTVAPGLLGRLPAGAVTVSVTAYNSAWRRPGGLGTPGTYDVFVTAAEAVYGAATVQ